MAHGKKKRSAILWHITEGGFLSFREGKSVWTSWEYSMK
jgi:hypothetical protein